MPLPMQQVAVQLPGQAGAYWRGIPMSCHVATLIWLHHASTGNLPAGFNEIPKIGNANEVLRRIFRRGVRLRVNHRQDVPLVPGSVLVFERNGEPMHSCVAVTNKKIAGYNQTDWFRQQGGRQAGIASQFTEHQILDVDWVMPFPSDKAKAGANGVYICSLYMVPERAAIEEYAR